MHIALRLVNSLNDSLDSLHLFIFVRAGICHRRPGVHTAGRNIVGQDSVQQIMDGQNRGRFQQIAFYDDFHNSNYQSHETYKEPRV
jgi:hypothetical protein